MEKINAKKEIIKPVVKLASKPKMSYTDMIRVYGAERTAAILNNF